MNCPRALGISEALCAGCGSLKPGAVLSAYQKDEAPGLLALCDMCIVDLVEAVRDRREAERLRSTVDSQAPVNVGVTHYGREWPAIRARILERDGNTCQDEGHKQAGGSDPRDRLVVHHIKPLREFGGDYNTANQEENLITLCTMCHGRWHSRLYHEAKAAGRQ